VDRLIFNTHDIVLLATIYQIILYVALMLVIKRERHQSDYFLIGFLLVQACIPFHILVNYGEAFRFIALEFSPNLYRIFETAYWIEGPLLLWYTRALCYKNYRLSRFDGLYLVPIAVFVVYNTATFFILDKQTKIDFFYDYKTINASLTHHLSGLIREVFRVSCSILCLIEIRRYRKHMHEQFSSIEKIDLSWLRYLVAVFFVLQVWAVMVNVSIIFSAHFNFNINFNSMGLIGNYTAFILVSVLIFFSISRTTFLEGVVDHTSSPHDGKHPKTEPDVDPVIVSALEQHMEAEKPHLANILTLEQLAAQLEISPRVLSNTINRHFHHNFFEFINRYRVEEAKKQLANPELKTKTIIDIMGDSGFNSKATFNTFFKKIEGMTPSEYRKNVKE